jgi:hypothetical protein
MVYFNDLFLLMIFVDIHKSRRLSQVSQNLLQSCPESCDREFRAPEKSTFREDMK